eukprot:5289366-Prymnesium_polylepis.1
MLPQQTLQGGPNRLEYHARFQGSRICKLACSVRSDLRSAPFGPLPLLFAQLPILELHPLCSVRARDHAR